MKDEELFNDKLREGLEEFISNCVDGYLDWFMSEFKKATDGAGVKQSERIPEKWPEGSHAFTLKERTEDFVLDTLNAERILEKWPEGTHIFALKERAENFVLDTLNDIVLKNFGEDIKSHVDDWGSRRLKKEGGK